MQFSTIAAISTPRGKGGVAVLRVSGGEALSIAKRVFVPFAKKAITDYPARTQIYGNITSFNGGEVLDDGLLTYFLAPHSFTGEEVVEIACHGGEVVTSMVLSALLSAGAVLAEPGEFSRRAFLNGKLSLTAAEGIADLLDAKTEAAAQLSSKTARGKLSGAITALSEDILSVSSSLWAYLDYPEEDLQSMSDVEMVDKLEEILSSCDNLLNSYQTGRAVNSGISAAIIGKPNAGKSTFFNALLGEDRAIVTDIPGTTRDVIEYPVKMGRVLLNLSDTAGVREETEDAIEKMGIRRAFAAIEEAELIFALFDLSRPFDREDRIVLERLEMQKEKSVILPVFTKNDLPQLLDRSYVASLGEGIEISAYRTPQFRELIDFVEKHFISDEAALREGAILTNARQKAGVEKTRDLILEAKEQILASAKDLASLTMENALASLLDIDGKSAGEKILDQVFSRFCVGK